MKKVVMYWHNGRSLGHTAEVAKISKKIEEVYKDWPMVGLTGAYKGLDLLSKKWMWSNYQAFQILITLMDGIISRCKDCQWRNYSQ